MRSYVVVEITDERLKRSVYEVHRRDGSGKRMRFVDYDAANEVKDDWNREAMPVLGEDVDPGVRMLVEAGGFEDELSTEDY